MARYISRYKPFEVTARVVFKVTAITLYDQNFRWERYSKLSAAAVSFSANEETHPELLQVHHQTVVRKTGGKPAEEDGQLLVHSWTSRQVMA